MTRNPEMNDEPTRIIIPEEIKEAWCEAAAQEADERQKDLVLHAKRTDLRTCAALERVACYLGWIIFVAWVLGVAGLTIAARALEMI